MFASVFGFLAGLTFAQNKVDIDKEKAAVVAVNEEERDAYFDRDLARLEAIWIPEPTSKYEAEKNCSSDKGRWSMEDRSDCTTISSG